MTISKEIDMEQWLLTETWSGAKEWIAEISISEVRQLASMMEELFEDGVSETSLNDFVWFEVDVWAQFLGYTDAEDMLDKKKG